jgi:hypothetical protein
LTPEEIATQRQQQLSAMQAELQRYREQFGELPE